MQIAILMPVFDEAARLHETLMHVRASTGARASGEETHDVTVFLVDDGSEPPVAAPGARERLPGPTPSFRVVLARHIVNLGQGAALETARQLALRARPARPFDAFVTMDSDGQHDPSDALSLALAVQNGADVAFGNRFAEASDMPPSRRALLHSASIFERFLTGLRLADAHNGLRAFSRRALEQVPLRQNRMAHATEIKQRVARAHGLTVVEVPVTVRYSAATLAKGQRGVGAALILRDLLGRYLFGEAE
jgi:glycosyltransferase involved in cell wall biosynthesis